MAKKVLFVANLLNKHIIPFHLPYLQWLKERNFITFVYSKKDTDKKLPPEIDFFEDFQFSRNLLSITNFYLIFILVKKLRYEKFDIVHCHTPIPAAILRISTLFLNKSIKPLIIYTAHGFHFYKGSSIFSWILYFPIEYFLAFFTSKIITINHEDFLIAKKFFRSKILFTNGIGINFYHRQSNDSLSKFTWIRDMVLKYNYKVLLSVGEINKNKNHLKVIDAINMIQEKNFLYLIIGSGPYERMIKNKLKLYNLENRVFLLGQLTKEEVYEIMRIANLYVHPSFREGISFAIMEAMYNKLPAIVSNIRGNSELIDDFKGGYLINPNSSLSIMQAIIKFNLLSKKELETMGVYNFIKVEKFSFSSINHELESIYEVSK